MKLEEKKTRGKRWTQWQWWTKVSAIGLGGCVLLFLLLLLYLRSQPLPIPTINETTMIYGEGNKVIASLYKGENRKSISFGDIPVSVRQATVAVEDKKFYNHTGFDFTRILSAGFTDITHFSKLQGASTITMQLARNLYLTLDKTWMRKIKEALLTLQLEVNYSKDQLLEMYLNQIYYGHSAYGIEAAAKTYFNKSASQLDLAEGSMLAGIPKGPKFYSPFLNYENAKTRQQIVLHAMVEQKFITQAQADEAYQEPLHLAAKKTGHEAEKGPYFIDYVEKVARDKYHIDEETFQHGGLQIYTTLDPDMQQMAEQAVQKYLPSQRPLQASLLAIEPQTGYIKAMVGGRDYKQSQFNRVFAQRPPGSAIKPVLYLAALENGFTPLTQIKDEPTVFTYENGKSYTPKNFGNDYTHQFMNMKQAIARSDNIYAVTTHMQIGNDKMLDMAKRLGIQSNLKELPSQALGPEPVTPFELTKAFATLANQGNKIEPIAIKKIIDREGRVLVEENPQSTQVAEPVNTFILTQMMQGVFEDGGTAYRIHTMIDRPVAGKTGSTDYDAWLCGFTPQLVTSVWVGYDDNRVIDSVYDSHQAQPIWASFMNQALKNQPKVNQQVPPGVTAAYIDPTSNQLATDQCPNKRVNVF